MTRIEDRFRRLETLILQQQQLSNQVNERDREDEISRLTEIPPNQLPTSPQPLTNSQTVEHSPKNVSEIMQSSH